MKTHIHTSSLHDFKNSVTKLVFTIIILMTLNIPFKSNAGNIVKFDAVYTSGSVYFSWELATSVAFSHLEIERSSDSLNFLSLIIFNGANNRLFAWDKEPIPGKSYYRLKLTDLNGLVEYSAIESMKIKMLSSRETISVLGNKDNQEEQNTTLSASCRKIMICDVYGNVTSTITLSDFEDWNLKNRLGSFPVSKPLMILYLKNNQVVRKQIFLMQN